jgi:hypothetical protein
MFRSVDARGNISNPSSVYEVELITLEDGTSSPKQAVLPLIRAFKFPVFDTTKTKKDFRKYLMIKPAPNQSVINNIETNNVSFGIPLAGDENFKSIFSEKDVTGGKKFKLRITSKSTGRKMDLNFEFKQKHEIV